MTKHHFLGLTEVMSRVSLSKTAIYELIARKDFPIAVRVSKRRVAWVESEIDKWIADRMENR